VKSNRLLLSLTLVPLLFFTACAGIIDEIAGNLALPTKFSLSEPNIPDPTGAAKAQQGISYFNNATTSAINKIELFINVEAILSASIYNWSVTADTVDLTLTAKEVSTNIYEWTLKANGTGNPFSEGTQTFTNDTVIAATFNVESATSGIISEFGADNSLKFVTAWSTSPTNNTISAFSGDGGSFGLTDIGVTFNIGADVNAYYYALNSDGTGQIFYSPVLTTNRFSIKWTENGTHGTLETEGNASPNYAAEW